MSLNVKKALDVVKKFEMVWPDAHGNDTNVKSYDTNTTGNKRGNKNSIKLEPINHAIVDKRVTTGDMLGLYKKGTNMKSLDNLSNASSR